MTGRSGYYGYRGNTWITRTSFAVRKNIYEVFAAEFGAAATILDVGATSEASSREANVLEALFPHKDRITAAGVEDASHLEVLYPGMKFTKIQPGRPLPFGDDAFEVAYSHAVIEHIVDEGERVRFLSELGRVARAVFVTTPNKYFPIEPHTFVPLLHFVAPPLFYALLDTRLTRSFYNRSNLRLLSKSDVRALARRIPSLCSDIRSVRLFGLVSNFILIGRRAPAH